MEGVDADIDYEEMEAMFTKKLLAYSFSKLKNQKVGFSV